MKNNENISIFRGGAIGVAMGYALALHFGLIIGLLLGIVTAIIVCDPLRLFQAHRNVQGELAAIRQGLTADIQKFGKRWERQTRWTVNSLKGILIVGLIFISYIPACLLWHKYFWETPYGSGSWNMFDTGGTLTMIIIINILGLMIATYPFEDSSYLNGKIRSSGPLSWPIMKNIIGWVEKSINCISKGLSAWTVTADNGHTCSFFDSLKELFESRRKQTECDFRVIIFFSGLFILFSCLLIIAPSRQVMIPIWGEVVLLVLLMAIDIVLMILMRCMTTAITATASGAAIAIIGEWYLYPHFNNRLSGDWIRFGAFMVIGGMTGVAIYQLRKHLLVDNKSGLAANARS